MTDQNAAESTQSVSNSSLNSAAQVADPSDVLTTETPKETSPEVVASAPAGELQNSHLRPVEPEEEPKDTPQELKEEQKAPPVETVDWTSKIEQLQNEVSEARNLVDEMKKAEADRQKKARISLVQDDWGLLDLDYMKIPSFPSKADATTEEGREELRQWMVKHPGLFNKAPKISAELKKDAAKQITVQSNSWRWSDIWKG